MITVLKSNQKRCNPHAAYVDADGTRHIKMPADLYTEIQEPAKPKDHSTDYYCRTEQDDAPYVTYTRKSDVQIAQVVQSKAKQVRAQEVSEIVVTTAAGNQFDGHEDAQNRMNRAINILTDADLIPWVLADNTVVNVGKAELLEALRLSGMAQSALWAKPYL
jgi:hypothetical protein